MSTVEAIRTYFGSERKVETKELMELKKGLSNDEWEALGKACCAALKVEWTKA